MVRETGTMFGKFFGQVPNTILGQGEGGFEVWVEMGLNRGKVNGWDGFDSQAHQREAREDLGLEPSLGDKARPKGGLIGVKFFRSQIFFSQTLARERRTMVDMRSPRRMASRTLERRKPRVKICLDTKCSFSINALLVEEMPIEKHKTRSSPSVIARLMGLDTLPSVGPLKSQNEVNHDDSLLKKSKDEFLEFKDVFEVMDAPKVQKCNNQIAHKGMACSKVGENDMAFVRQSFINAKHLSTVEKLQRSKEFDDALEVLDSNKDFFLKLLQEPQSLFSKHLQELPYSPLSPHASHASVLKPSRAIQRASLGSSLRSEENAERYTNMQRRKMQSFGKRADKLPSFPSRKPMCSLPEKLSNSMYDGNGEDRAHPSEIVILKPGPEKGGNAERAFPLAYFMSSKKHGVIDHRKLLKAEFMELNDKERGQKKSCDTLEPTRHRTKGSTEIAGEVNQRSRLGNARKFSVSYYSYNDKDENLEIKLAKSNKSQAPYCDNNEFCSSFNQLSCPIESAIDRGSSRCESDQCRVTHHFEESSLSSRASNTLGEILALSDKETFKRNLDTLSVRKSYPVGISSKDGWKDGFCRNLPQSKYLPASSVIYRNFQNNHGDQIGSSKSRFKPKNSHDMSKAMGVHEELVRRKCSSHDYGGLSNGAGNRIHVRDIHVNAEKLENRTFVGSLAEECLVTCKSSDNYSSNMVDNIYLPRFISGKRTSAADVGFENPRNITKSEDNRKQVSCNHRAILPKEASAGHCEKVILPSYCALPFTVSPDNYKESSQPSPVSVLELSPKKGKSAVGCFKRLV
ncbi:hypothetical protein HPP92_012465 [Vanilla planifolia]|uniref:DUF3741 domain-containing protein n=1 Tax=Vanilla planifolia TaxID=51239 RepID=A0A835R7T3_VANPL|nr:hypothetical protein HPP92_012465 [Vanilla planifolia]